jgi:hypothetical protein
VKSPVPQRALINARRNQEVNPMTNKSRTEDDPNLGDLVIVLLAATLAGLRDRLKLDGFPDAARCVAETVDVTDHYVERLESHSLTEPKNKEAINAEQRRKDWLGP